MKPIWDQSAWEDYLWWQTQDRRVLRRATPSESRAGSVVIIAYGWLAGTA